MVDSTKEYIRRAVVTVVDHLGSVSANLECRLMKTDPVSETELRIDSLKQVGNCILLWPHSSNYALGKLVMSFCCMQRLGTCQHYSHLFALTTNSWNDDFPRHHPRYISPRNVFQIYHSFPLFSCFCLLGYIIISFLIKIPLV